MDNPNQDLRYTAIRQLKRMNYCYFLQLYLTERFIVVATY